MPTIDAEVEERDCLAAVALAFAAQTDVPRERALVQSAIASLVASQSDRAFTKASALDIISRHGRLPELRSHVAAQVFENLLRMQILRQLPDSAPPQYALNDAVVSQMRRNQDAIHKRIDDVVKALFADLSLTSSAVADLRGTLLRCIASVMSVHGQQYASQIAGRVDHVTQVSRDELISICKKVVSGASVTRVTPGQMADAVSELFARRDPVFSYFVFSLAQNYYYLCLLGLAGGLELLSADRYNGSQFWLDTNAAFALLFAESRHHRSVIEMCELSLRLHISLHVSEYTLDEFRRVCEYNRTQLAKTFDEVPEELLASTRSVFLKAYRAQKGKDPSLTVEEFFDSIRDVRERLKSDWGVTVADYPIEGETDKSKYKDVQDTMQQSSLSTRGYPKQERALQHDAHQYLLIMKERKDYGDRAAWLLTLDSSLPGAASVLQGPDEMFYCMSLDGFLQVMSPYVRSDHQQKFADMFIEIVGRNLFPPEQVLELEDFRMFTDLNLSVRSLPSPDVKAVMRRVKKALGGDLRSAALKQIAYEVQKALSDPTLSFKAENRKEIEQLQGMLAKGARLMELKDAELKALSSTKDAEKAVVHAESASQINALREALRRSEEETADEKRRSKQESRRATRLATVLRVFIASIMVVLCAVTLWVAPVTLFASFRHPNIVRTGVTLVMASLWFGIVRKEKASTIVAMSAGLVGTALALGSALI